MNVSRQGSKTNMGPMMRYASALVVIVPFFILNSNTVRAEIGI